MGIFPFFGNPAIRFALIRRSGDAILDPGHARRRPRCDEAGTRAAASCLRSLVFAFPDRPCPRFATLGRECSELPRFCRWSPRAAPASTVPPPLPSQPVTETHWGVAVPDPYRFLEDVKDPKVQGWLKGQANATEALLASIPGRATLLARMREIEDAAAGLTNDVVRTESNRYFFQRRNPGEGQFKLVWRDGADGTDTVIVDPEALTKATGRPHAIMDFAPSRDGRLLAYSIQVGGGEIGTLHVIDVATGKPVIEPVDRIRYGSTAWLDDGSGFFYSRLRRGLREAAAGRALPRPHATLPLARRRRRPPHPQPESQSGAEAAVLRQRLRLPDSRHPGRCGDRLPRRRAQPHALPRRPRHCDPRRGEVAQGRRRRRPRHRCRVHQRLAVSAQFEGRAALQGRAHAA